MKCINHPESEAVGSCSECGSAFCLDCGKEIAGKYYCSKCLGKIVATQATPQPPSPPPPPSQAPTSSAPPQYPPVQKRSTASCLLIGCGILLLIFILSFLIIGGLGYLGYKQAQPGCQKIQEEIEKAKEEGKLKVPSLTIPSITVPTIPTPLKP